MMVARHILEAIGYYLLNNGEKRVSSISFRINRHSFEEPNSVTRNIALEVFTDMRDSGWVIEETSTSDMCETHRYFSFSLYLDE